MNPKGLYIHVPFCEKKCPYCDFYSITATDDIIERYTYEVCKNLISYSKNFKWCFDTIYFGGGTPSLLGNKNLTKIIEVVRNNFKFFEKEVTLEINPMTFSSLDLKNLRKNGFNRLSIGVQSAVDSELNLLGRHHSVEDVEKTIIASKRAGFTNISLDLMIAIPYQTIDSLKKSIDFCISQNVQHISAYLLKLEQGTLFYENKNHLHLKSEEEEAEMYLFLTSELKNNGFQQYEISNFAKDGFKGIHNLKYWNSDEYLGIGPSAHSFIDGKRFFYPRSIEKFLSGDTSIVNDGYGGYIEEYVMLRLRLLDGLNNKIFKNRFGIDIPKIYFEKAKQFQKYDLIYVDEENIKLTTKGFLISNELISKIIL